MTEILRYAPGRPGIAPRWTSSAKSGVGTSINPASKVWFTLSHGIFNEIYYPRLDQANTRDMGLIVTDGRNFFSEEKRHASSELKYPAVGVPAYRLTNTCKQGRNRIEKEILSNPRRDSLLQQTRFVALKGRLQEYHLYVLLAPHLGNHGAGNLAWLDDYKGVPMLFAERDGNGLALACSALWLKRSVGFAGVSDGWQDLTRNKRLTWEYDRAENGNVALCAEIDLAACSGSFLLVLAFGLNAAEAGHRALASIYDGFDPAKSTYISEWQEWQQSLRAMENGERDDGLFHVSTAVLTTHEAKNFFGGLFRDASDISEKELFFGRPSGSAMPLVWAHAEYVKLRRSLLDGRVFDMPHQTVERYLVNKISSHREFWRFNHKIMTMDQGSVLRVEVLSEAEVRWSKDGWRSFDNVSARDTGLGVHYADLPTGNLPESGKIEFTFYWMHSRRWENRNFTVTVTTPGQRQTSKEAAELAETVKRWQQRGGPP